MARIPTVKVQNGKGDFRIINESDFDPDTMTLWEEGKGASGTEAPTDPAERIEAIKGAIGQLDPDTEGHFTKAGKPEVKALEAILGYDISAAERNEAAAALTGE